MFESNCQHERKISSHFDVQQDHWKAETKVDEKFLEINIYCQGQFLLKMMSPILVCAFCHFEEDNFLFFFKVKFITLFFPLFCGIYPGGSRTRMAGIEFQLLTTLPPWPPILLDIRFTINNLEWQKGSSYRIPQSPKNRPYTYVDIGNNKERFIVKWLYHCFTIF